MPATLRTAPVAVCTSAGSSGTSGVDEAARWEVQAFPLQYFFMTSESDFADIPKPTPVARLATPTTPLAMPARRSGVPRSFGDSST